MQRFYRTVFSTGEYCRNGHWGQVSLVQLCPGVFRELPPGVCSLAGIQAISTTCPSSVPFVWSSFHSGEGSLGPWSSTRLSSPRGLPRPQRENGNEADNEWNVAIVDCYTRPRFCFSRSKRPERPEMLLPKQKFQLILPLPNEHCLLLLFIKSLTQAVCKLLTLNLLATHTLVWQQLFSPFWLPRSWL